MSGRTAAEWAARIELVRATDGIPLSRGYCWQTLSGPISRPTPLPALPDPITRQCSRCGDWQPLTERFFRHPKGPGGYLTKCRSCTVSVRRALRQRRALGRVS